MFARETSIKVSPYGVSLYVIQCFQAKLLSVPLVGGGGGSCMVSSYGTLLQCCTRSAGQVRRSLLSDGPLLYKCSIR